MLKVDPWTTSEHVECNVKMQHVMSMELLPALSGCFTWSLVTGKSRSLNMVVCADVHSMVHSQQICKNKRGIMFHMRLILFLFHHLAAHLNMPLQHFCTTAWTLSCDILSCCVLIQYENQSTWTNCPTGFSQFRCTHSFFIEWGFGRLGWSRFHPNSMANSAKLSWGLLLRQPIHYRLWFCVSRDNLKDLVG